MGLKNAYMGRGLKKGLDEGQKGLKKRFEREARGA